MIWTYADVSNLVVVRTNADGSMQSGLVSNPDVQAWIDAGNVPAPYVPPQAPPQAPPQEILSQDLMVQFTTDDAAKIQAAVAGNAQFWLLWSAMQAQKDPMGVTNARFLAGWSALVQVLGASRMTAIATALNVTVAI